MPNLSLNSETLLMAFLGVTAVAFLLQALILLCLLFALRKGAKAIQQELEDLRSSVSPLVSTTQKLMVEIAPAITSTVRTTQQLVDRLAPKAESIMGDLNDVAHNLRGETEKVQETTLEIIDQVRKQCDRIDGMLTSLLDTLARAGDSVFRAVNRPVQQMQGFVASVKSAVESMNRAVPPRPQPKQDDPNRYF